jgi:hypothetical protein
VRAADKLNDYGPGEYEKTTYLMPSMFHHRPATVWFEYPPSFGITRKLDADAKLLFRSRKGNRLLFRVKKNINCICQTVRRAGFSRLVTGKSWNFMWAGTLPAAFLQKLDPYQKVNHFPGSWHLGRKDHLCRALNAMARVHGAAYDIAPRTYLLPEDYKLWERDFEESGRGTVFIRKPPADAEGRGIYLVTKLDQVNRKGRHVIQEYVAALMLPCCRPAAALQHRLRPACFCRA